ncbi:MAG: cytochrome c [Planctomycetota bacterium]|nr:MAG: cytochrome c [Planctomycetota bacterium]
MVANLRTLALASACAGAALLAVGCGSKTKTKPPIQWQRNMYDTQRADPQEEYTWFPDDRAMRRPVPDTVPRGRSAADSTRPDPDLLAADDHLYRGLVDGKPAESFPMPVTRALLERGQRQFNIFCAACHDRAGSGQAIVPRRGLAPPPKLWDERIRKQAVGYIFQTISNGRATMPPYRHSIPPRDRWAIVAYVRALQASVGVPVDQLDPETRKKIQTVEMPQ